MPPAGLNPTLIASCLLILANRAHHDEAVWQRRVDRLFAGGGLDEVGSRHHADPAGARHIAQRSQLARRQDRLHVGVATGLAEGAHLVVERPPVAGQHVGARDDDIDLTRARLHRGANLLKLERERILPRGKASGDGGDGDIGPGSASTATGTRL